MKEQWPPQPDTVIEWFEPIARPLQGALSTGMADAYEYFVTHGWVNDIDPWAFPHLTRLRAARELQALDLANLGFELQPLGFSGLWLRSEHLDVRVLKIDHRPDRLTNLPQRRIPHQGVTAARRAYYYQPAMVFDEEALSFHALLRPQRVKTLVLWDTDPSYSELTTFDFACPKFLNERKRLVETHFWVPINLDGTGELSPGLLVTGKLLEDLNIEAFQEAEEADIGP